VNDVVTSVEITNLLDSDEDCEPGSCLGTMHGANRTNFYIHGLTIDPKLNDPLTFTLGDEQKLKYIIKIPPDHPPGLYWYSSHSHGSASLHVMGGLVGALIIKPAESELKKIPESFLSLPRYLCLLTHIMLEKNEENIEIYQDSIFASSLSHSTLARETKSAMSLNISYEEAIIKDAWFTNGLYQPSLTVNANEYFILDLIVASGDRFVEIEVRNYSFDGRVRPICNDDSDRAHCDERVCNMSLIALDGVYLSDARSLDRLLIPQGGRASLYLLCPKPGIFYMQSSSSLDYFEAYFQTGDYESKSIQPLVILDVKSSNSSIPATPPMNLSFFSRPSYLQDIDQKDEAAVLSINFDQSGASSLIVADQLFNNIASLFWIGIGSDCDQPDDCFDDTHCQAFYGSNYSAALDFPTAIAKDCFYHNITAAALNPSTLHTVNISANGHMEVVVSTRKRFQYPFSIQGQSLRLVEYIPLAGLTDAVRQVHGFEYDEWRDSWIALPGKMRFRTRATSHAGMRYVFSNFLKYQDRGLISGFLINRINSIRPSSNDSSQPPEMGASIDIDSSVADSFHAPAARLCNPFGSSFVYEERVKNLDRVRSIITSSCPNHYSICQSSGCSENATLALQYQREVDIPLFPMISSQPKDTTCSDRILGYALNGVPIFGPADGHTSICGTPKEYGLVDKGRTSCNRLGDGDGTLYCGDAVQELSSSVDVCGGQADERGRYNYRSLPTCLHEQLKRHYSRENSPQIGWAIDGFPIFGPIGPKGIAMLPCSHPEAHQELCLDQCNGYAGVLSNYDSYTYRYYMTGPLGAGSCSSHVKSGDRVAACARESSPCCISEIPSQSLFPYTIGCIVGCLLNDTTCRVTSRGYTKSFLPIASAHPTAVYVISSLPSSVKNTSKPVNETQTILQNSSDSQAILSSVLKQRSGLMKKPFTSYYAIFNNINQSIWLVSTPNDQNVLEASTIKPLPTSSKDFYITKVVLDDTNLDRYVEDVLS
jgi:FtsP/CotA-like multicopper oxidase with cupredoxin domain